MSPASSWGLLVEVLGMVRIIAFLVGLVGLVGSPSRGFAFPFAPVGPAPEDWRAGAFVGYAADTRYPLFAKGWGAGGAAEVRIHEWVAARGGIGLALMDREDLGVDFDPMFWWDAFLGARFAPLSIEGPLGAIVPFIVVDFSILALETDQPEQFWQYEEFRFGARPLVGVDISLTSLVRLRPIAGVHFPLVRNGGGTRGGVGEPLDRLSKASAMWTVGFEADLVLGEKPIPIFSMSLRYAHESDTQETFELDVGAYW